MLTGKNNDGHSFDLAHMFKLSRILAARLSFPCTNKEEEKQSESVTESDCVILYRHTDHFFFFAG